MRTTDDKKGNILRIRVNEEMNRYLIKRSVETGVNISEYIRKLIDRDIKNK